MSLLYATAVTTSGSVFSVQAVLELKRSIPPPMQDRLHGTRKKRRLQLMNKHAHDAHDEQK
jgi:hypothetical protein